MNAHYVYKITNINPVDSRKYYIGVRTAPSGNPEEDTKYMSSSKHLKEAIKQQGKECFIKEILSVWDKREHAVLEEIRLHDEYSVNENIEFYNKAKQTSSKFDYNSTGKIVSEETKKKLSIAAKNRPPMSLEQREKLRLAGLGKKLSEETKKKMSNAIKGRKHKPESIEKMRVVQSNRSAIQREKMLIAAQSWRGEKNQSASRIQIFDNDGNMRFDTYGTFEKICRENNLPQRSLRESYYNDGKKLFQTNLGFSKATKNGFGQFKGWYAIKID